MQGHEMKDTNRWFMIAQWNQVHFQRNLNSIFFMHVSWQCFPDFFLHSLPFFLTLEIHIFLIPFYLNNEQSIFFLKMLFCLSWCLIESEVVCWIASSVQLFSIVVKRWRWWCFSKLSALIAIFWQLLITADWKPSF